MAKRNTVSAKILQTLVDRYVEKKKSEKDTEADLSVLKTQFKDLGVGIYEGTNKNVKVTDGGSSRLNEKRLFSLLTDELGLTVKKANEMIDKAKVFSPSQTITIIDKED